MQEWYYKYVRELVMAFLDIEQIYYSVNQNKVWEVVVKKGLVKCTVRSVWKSESRVQVGGKI